MTAFRISALTAASAIGVGLAATRDALRQRRGGLTPCDLPAMPADIWIGRVRDAEAIALPPDLAAFACRNTRLAELALRQDGFAEAVAAARSRLGSARIAVVLGTSTSGIAATEAAWARRDADGALPAYDFARTHDLHALPRYLRARLGLDGPCVSISTACTSGARSFLDAAMLIEAGFADAAVVGGADTLCGLTLHGFASLELLARGGPTRPCAADRDGISIGEAAAFALIERAEPADAGRIGLLGAGASADGHHMSSPHPDGLGALAAIEAALASAGLDPGAIDYVNMHGTGTRANDAMEDRAVARIFGATVPCSSTKGWTGHTLGASGALEAAISLLCIEDGLIPGCLGVTAVDPEFGSGIAVANRAARLDRVLSNSFGFGGSNCALVIGRLP